MKIYEYMVTYVADGVTGRCRIMMGKKIKSYEDVQKIDPIISELNDNKLKNPTAMNFILLRTYRGKM